MPVASATWSSATRASSSKAMRTSGSGFSSCPAVGGHPEGEGAGGLEPAVAAAARSRPDDLEQVAEEATHRIVGVVGTEHAHPRQLRGAAEGHVHDLVPVGAGLPDTRARPTVPGRQHVEAGPQLGHGAHRAPVDRHDDLAPGQAPAGRAGRARPRPRRRPCPRGVGPGHAQPAVVDVGAATRRSSATPEDQLGGQVGGGRRPRGGRGHGARKRMPESTAARRGGRAGGSARVVEDPDDRSGRVEERCSRRGQHARGRGADRGHVGGDAGMPAAGPSAMVVPIAVTAPGTEPSTRSWPWGRRVRV